ncbi:MAG: hypothetical protein WC627_12865 [Legionella sp.]|jgi:hypothetical protein
MSNRKNSKLGRPSDYTQELADLICERVATHGIGLKKLCEMYGDMPEKITIRRWCLKYPQFRSQYAQAKSLQIETLIDEIMDIADDSTGDTVINEQGKTVCNNEFIARSKIRIDTRKWLASKLAPKIYGVDPIGIAPPPPEYSLAGVTDPNEAARIYQQIMRRGS